VPDYLSPEWFDIAADLLAADSALSEITQGVHFVLQQSVTGDGETIVWQVSFNDGEVSLLRGTNADADVTFTCDRGIAESIRSGTTSAQTAFIAGQLRIGGSVGALLQHGEMLAALDDVLAPLR